MGETMPTKTKPKTMVSRDIAIALGIICIVLILSLVGAFAYCMPTINDKNNTISSLNTQISQLNSDVTELTNRGENLFNIVNLLESTVLLGPYNISLSPYNNSRVYYNQTMEYAGFVNVRVSFSTTTNGTSVEAIYSGDFVDYDNTLNIRSNGFENFPVLPQGELGIWLTNPSPDNATETITITYYY